MKVINTVAPVFALSAFVNGQNPNFGDMCQVPNNKSIGKIIKKLVDNQYDCDNELPDKKSFCENTSRLVKEKIKDTNRAPCKWVRDADAIFKRKNIKDLSAYNCHDKECDIAIDLRGIWGYGCWCHFGNKLTNGRGKPVSAHDKACQNMQLCLRCAEMDGGKDGYECDAKTAHYNSTLGQSSGQNNNQNALNSQCSSLNPGDLCGAHICTCEIQLINDILALVWEQEAYDISPRHPDNPFGGFFSFEANCETNPGITEIDCCGKYPFRSTYNSLHRNCCLATEQLYNPFDTVCCADGLYPIGNGGC